MPRRQEPIKPISEICVDSQPVGIQAVYLVETRSEQEAREIGTLFAEMESQVQVRRLCSGKLVSYAVQTHRSDSSILDEIEDFLKTNYAFVVTQRSFDEIIYRIVRELCQDTGSDLLPMPRCNICGKPEPFANTAINLTGEDGSVLLCRSYCARCTAEAAAPNNKDFIRSLLAADEHDFRKLEQADLVRRPSRRRPIRFRIKAAN